MARIYPDGRRKGRASPPPLLPVSRKHVDHGYAARYRPRGRSVAPLRLRRFLRSRLIRLLLYMFVLWNILEVFLVRRRLASDELVSPGASGSSIRSTQATKPQRIYVASMHWNNGYILSERWNNAVVELARVLGPQNIFVSVFESGSWDDSKEALSQLDHQLDSLNVPRNITLSDLTHLEEISRVPEGEGWIETSRGGRELRRIPYLASLRNRTLRDLIELHKVGVHFDKVLFLNDVVFTVRFSFQGYSVESRNPGR